jgi:hypothetical protein
MISKRQRINLAKILMVALLVSGSFCLHILTMAVMADSDSQSVPTEPMVKNTNATAACCSDCDQPAEPSLSQPPAPQQLNCCSSQTIKPTITTSNPDLLNSAAVAWCGAIPAAVIVNPVGAPYYQTVILSPPETPALRAIVKLE